MTPPSAYYNLTEGEKTEIIRQIGDDKKRLTRDIKKYKKQHDDYDKDDRSEELTKRFRMSQLKYLIDECEKDHKHLSLLSERLKVMRGFFKRGEGFMQFIDLPLLKKQKFLLVKDKRGNPLLSGKVSKDFIDLVTKRFNSKKKYKGSPIETFRLLNKMFPISKRSKKVKFCSSKPIFYDNPRDLIDHLDLILGSIEAGNNNLKNEGIAVIDELLKTGVINQKGHERIYKRFLI